MKDLLFSCILVLIFFTGSFAQHSDNNVASKNAAYIEFGTNIIISSASLNYERHFFSSKSQKVHLYGRAGFGGAAVFWSHAGWGALAGMTLVTGKENHHFETSAGLFLGYENYYSYNGGDVFALPLLDLGYRFQKPGKGFIFRAKVGVLSFGIGLGYSF